METFKVCTMNDKETEATEFENDLEGIQDPKDYPDGFNPDLYDL
jgi:hypothetical protein|tara:strand:+ start:479 stop:610 length:132 start_codon:yes stop_codon:yes gene_type:complete